MIEPFSCRNLKGKSPLEEGESYEGPEDAKQVDLAWEGEESKKVWIATNLTLGKEALLISTLKEYQYVFAWSYKDLKGVDPTICQHTIPMKEIAQQSRQIPYMYNDNFSNKIQEEIDKLLEVKFIYEIEHNKWFNRIVIVPKKNEKSRVCVKLKKVMQP